MRYLLLPAFAAVLLNSASVEAGPVKGIPLTQVGVEPEETVVHTYVPSAQKDIRFHRTLHHSGDLNAILKKHSWKQQKQILGGRKTQSVTIELMGPELLPGVVDIINKRYFLARLGLGAHPHLRDITIKVNSPKTEDAGAYADAFSSFDPYARLLPRLNENVTLKIKSPEKKLKRQAPLPTAPSLAELNPPPPAYQAHGY